MSKILIIEDNPDIALLYQRALLRHENLVANTAESAFDIMNNHQFDLIILDMHLPKKSGITVLEHVRNTDAHRMVKVCVISADDLLRRKCEDLGIDFWMTKPIELDIFMARIEDLLSQQPHS